MQWITGKTYSLLTMTRTHQVKEWLRGKPPCEKLVDGKEYLQQEQNQCQDLLCMLFLAERN